MLFITNQMNLNIKIINNNEEVSDFISSSVLWPLKMGQKVLLFISGGSVIPFEIEATKKIKDFSNKNLVVTLADERFGLPDSSDSNWFKLVSRGFDLPEAKLVPYLSGLSLSETMKKIKGELNEELSKAEYKIAILGLGLDGHTAGILPYSDAVTSRENICFFETPTYDRITITPKLISELNEVIVIAMGEDKWPIVSLLSKDISIEDQPAQILKKVPILTIFSDHK